MGYYIADSSELIDAFGEETILQLLDLDGDGYVDDENVVDRAIAAAESTTESYLAQVYTLATLRTDKPPIVVKLALDLALYNAALIRSAHLVGPETEFESIYNRAIEHLKDLAASVAGLDG